MNMYCTYCKYSLFVGPNFDAGNTRTEQKGQLCNQGVLISKIHSGIGLSLTES